ncbi:hypothetical protein MATL_G00134710 [Megalops atlanticus]|uniref:Protein DEK n=1 Tax=Megalops atlanticus TaxID=7932 RepID=A0A9D3PW63_MEGAT|nr:hypothetical protein MATL_G00134710 [Megalops atlanticus]
MNMEEVGDIEPTKKTKPEKRTLSEEMGHNDAEEPEKGSSPKYGTHISTGEIIEGKRQKKTVQRLDFQASKPKERLKIEQGKGEKLGEIVRVAYFIGKMKVDDLKPLHKILFDRPGAAASVKKNLRQFSGFSFEANSETYMKKMERMKRFTNSVLKNICSVLDLERSGTHDAKVERILTFLLDPKSSGKTLPKKKRKAKDSKRKAQRANYRKSVQEDKSRAIVTDSSSDDDDEQDSQGDKDTSAPAPKSRETISDDEGDSSDNATADKETDEDEGEGKESVKKTPAKRKISSVQKSKKSAAPAKKKVAKDKKAVKGEVSDSDKDSDYEEEPVKKPAPKKKPAPAKLAAKTKKADSSSGRSKKASNTSVESDMDDSLDDEPLIKMVKRPPTDDQLKETVTKLLKDANLEEVTMKQICKQVFDTYPDYDLSNRKDFIKQTVKQLIS